MTYNGNGWWQAADAYCMLWSSGGHPGNSGDPVRQWRAPSAGNIRITGNASDGDPGGGDGVIVTIKKGAQVLWQQTIANGNTTGITYDLTTAVALGEQISFVINRNSTSFWDSTNFDPTISLAGIAPVSLTVPNFGFEAPAVGSGNFQYSPTGGSWTFYSGGVSGNGSGFTNGNPAAPEGGQVAFVQGGPGAYISQSISGFQAGTSYIIKFAAAQRANYNHGGQDLRVYLDNILLGTFRPTSNNYLDYATASFTITAGAHILKFEGLNSSGGDNTAFLDNVRVIGSPLPGLGIEWVVTDQLGTPRIVFDKTGSLTGTKRHDYLPFGEELTVNQGLRTTSRGYGSPDGVRQKFTQKERDIETGLDFFEARYYGSTQGRFTSADDFLNDTTPVDPASWNLYAYVRNNPLRYTDPTGELIYAGDVTGTDRDELLKRANYTYGCKDCVSIDKNGFLSVNTTGLSKDVLKATQYLTDAITSIDPSKLFAVQVTNNNPQVAFGDSQAASAGVQLPGNNFKTSAVRIRLDFGDDKWVSGDKAAKDAFLNLVFAHEVAHFYPNYIQDPSDGRQTGPVVDAVNEIQQARGLLLRAEYSATKRTSSGEFVSLNFGTAKMKGDNIVRNRAGGIEVNKTNKVVTWIKRSVGGKGIN